MKHRQSVEREARVKDLLADGLGRSAAVIAASVNIDEEHVARTLRVLEREGVVTRSTGKARRACFGVTRGVNLWTLSSTVDLHGAAAPAHPAAA